MPFGGAQCGLPSPRATSPEPLRTQGSTERARILRVPLCPRWLSAFAFQRAESFVIHIPFLQDGEDGFHSESSPRQLPEDARRLLLIFRFFQPLLAKKFASLLFVAHALIGRVHGLLDHGPVYAPRLQLGNHAHPPQLLIVAPQRRV